MSDALRSAISAMTGKAFSRSGESDLSLAVAQMMVAMDSPSSPS
eukprot:CAMPEP_0175620826 /NCGR_PEP_ID=MMETSP0096-20121207/68116_1 /TAXON_ID=311494 /ORGANISM="Alexandrium monilatum, Strain CCMP3105" /LENGTH=43 /DNA_ID= /DNA_START= /DNA_END= /DNA_ORIENTATION=